MSFILDYLFLKCSWLTSNFLEIYFGKWAIIYVQFSENAIPKSGNEQNLHFSAIGMIVPPWTLLCPPISIYLSVKFWCLFVIPGIVLVVYSWGWQCEVYTSLFFSWFFFQNWCLLLHIRNLAQLTVKILYGWEYEINL